MALRKTGFCLSLVGLLACWGWPNGQADGLRGELAVVERERLWKCHGSYTELEQLDRQLESLQSERIDLLSRAQVRCDRLFQEQHARQLWQAEQSQMQARVEQVTRQFKAQTEREMKDVQARFLSQLKASLPEPDLQEMAAAAATRFRLEKQKELSLRLQARQRQLDEAVARFEDELSRQFQDEKVKLQVKLQLAEDESARRRLAAIEEELDARKAERRRLAEMEMRDYRSIDEGQLALEVREYEEGLRREIQPPAPDLSPLASRLRAVQKQRQAQLIQVVGSLEAAARDHFRAQLVRLRVVHQPAGEILPEAFLEPKERARLHKLAALVLEERRRRQAVYARLSGEIAPVVGEQARKRGLESVVTEVRLNLQLEDLTDVSLAGVSEL